MSHAKETDSMVERVSRIEAELSIQAQERRVAREELREDMEKILHALGELKIKMASQVLCPRPGLCIELEGEVKANAAKLEAVQSYMSEIRGGWKVMTILVAAAGACGGFATWALDHLTGK